jgi:hypothetical protein
MSDQGFDDERPRLLPRAGGGWLAVSQDGAQFPIGVTGETPEKALDLYRAELAEWRKLLTVSGPERA